MVGDLFYFYSWPLASCNHTYMYLFLLQSNFLPPGGTIVMDTQLVTTQVVRQATISLSLEMGSLWPYIGLQ